MFHRVSVCHHSPSTHVTEERKAAREPEVGMGVGGGGMAISRGQILEHTQKGGSERILIRILVLEDGGRGEEV